MKKFVVTISLTLITITLLSQSFSYLKIDLKTPDAEVYLDNVRIPKGSLATWMTIASGRHTIKAVKNGYYTFTNTFVSGNEEKKSITVYLEKNISSDLVITSKSSATQLEIDNTDIEWDSSIPLKMNLKPGIYTFAFSEAGKKSATKNIPISESRILAINVDLKSNYPDVKPEDIGRSIIPAYDGKDLYKPARKVEYDHTKQYVVGVLVGLVATVALGATAPEDAGTAAPFVLGSLVGSIAGGLTKPKEISVPDHENIKYNKETVPKLIREKNMEIEKKNSETIRLVEAKRMQKYNEASITVIQSEKQ